MMGFSYRNIEVQNAYIFYEVFLFFGRGDSQQHAHIWRLVHNDTIVTIFKVLFALTSSRSGFNYVNKCKFPCTGNNN